MKTDYSMVKLTKLEQFIAEASDALTFDQIAAQLNRTPRAIEQAYERMERKRKAEAIKHEPIEVLNSCAHCYTISAVLKEIERRQAEASAPKTASEETEAPRMKCDRCEMLSINGLPCHETGCPNMRKTWIDGEWIRFLECRECGCDVREGEACNCNEPIEEESPATFGEAPTTSPEAPQKSPGSLGARLLAGLAVGLAFAFTSPANASEYRGEVSCACEGICEMSGCDSDNCQCTLPEFGEVNPELESLWLMLGVQDWGDIDEEDFNDPFVCETTDRILQLENMEVIDGEVFPQSKGGAGN